VPPFFLALLCLFCLLGPLLLPAADNQDLSASLLPPLSRAHLLGTDALGRDLLARLAVGGRLSLLVAFLASTVSVAMGTAWGALAGWNGGLLDAALMRIVEILQSLPYMFLVIVLMALMGRSLTALFLALGLVQWLPIARVVRAQTMTLRERDYVVAARALGARPLRLWTRHVLPGCLGVVTVYATLSVPQIVLQEAFLSFLGLNASDCSWGLLVADGAQSMDIAPWLVTAPGIVLALTLACLQRLADGLQARWTVRTTS
jgi:oligopeptide transport system permease protein